MISGVAKEELFDGIPAIDPKVRVNQIETVFQRDLQGQPGCIFDPLHLPETTGARETRPARNRSQTVALVNQLLHGNIFEAHAVLLNKGKHFIHSLALRAVGRDALGK